MHNKTKGINHEKLVLAASIALLTACSAPQQSQINVNPQAALSQNAIVNNSSFSLVSKDVRSAQYVALVDSGRNNIEPIHPRQNVRITLENALAEQFGSQGFRLSVNSENTITRNPRTFGLREALNHGKPNGWQRGIGNHG